MADFERDHDTNFPAWTSTEYCYKIYTPCQKVLGKYEKSRHCLYDPGHSLNTGFNQLARHTVLPASYPLKPSDRNASFFQPPSRSSTKVMIECSIGCETRFKLLIVSRRDGKQRITRGPSFAVMLKSV